MDSKRSWCLKHVYAVIFMFMWVLLVHTNTSSASKCIETEREALLAIKKDLVDEANRLSSWVSSGGGDCCKWEGVSCDSLTGHVLQLHLANPWIGGDDLSNYQPLQGTLSPKLIELRNLTYLDLSDNYIQGDQDTVSFIGALTDLRYLDLSYNHFCDGQIISKLGNLTHLEYLNLRFSCYWDYDAEAVQNLDSLQYLDSLPNHHSLRYLDLSYHNLIGVSDWPEIVNKLPNLRNLSLDDCDLPPPNLSYTNTSSNKSPLASVSLSHNPAAINSSSIFKWLFNYNTTLVYLDLSSNCFCDGQIISKLGNLTHLEYLNLAYLYCPDDAPVKNLDWLPNHHSLRYLDLSGNNLSRVSDWPKIVNKLPNLRNLTLDFCDLPPPNLSYTNTSSNKSPLASVTLSNNPALSSSSIFKWLFNYSTTLVYLDLSHNSLTLIPDAAFTYMTSLAYLDLSVNELSGPIPEDLLRNTISLAYLALSYNNLSGPIPPNLFRNMTSLAYLYLFDNKLSGSIPANIFRYMTSLAYLVLSGNKLSGSIPDAFGNMSLLRDLDLSTNLLDGVIPQSIGQMDSLEGLDLSYNSLVGPMPDVTNLLSLKNLFLHGNHLSGRLPEIIGQLSSLRELDLGDNKLSGSIPANIFRYMTSLAYLVLSGNKLSGSIPDAFGNMSLLRDLDLSTNLLDGVIPQSIGQMDSLEGLDLSYNSLVGPMPDVTNLLSLKNLYLHGNHLSGRLPEIIRQLSSSLRELDLGGNKLLSGRIPESIGNLSSLEKLDLSDNRLSGRLPESIGQLFNLYYLNLSVNSLQGLVSEVHFSNLSWLYELNLADNNGLNFDVHSDWIPPFQLWSLNLRSCKLGPDFPKWLLTQQNCSNLDVSRAGISDVLPKNFWSLFRSFVAIDFSHNSIRGTFGNSSVELFVGEVRFSSNQMEGQIPSILSDVPYLDLSNNTFSEISSFLCAPKIKKIMYLDLSSNHVVEELPNCWTYLVHLQVLDLSNNEFSGTIPDSIGSLFRMETLKLRSNRLVGEFPLSLKNCTSLRVIDLGDNKLSSSVPEWIGVSFPSLIILLLQSNRFSGSLPRQLCHLTHMQNLDLSGNEISGTIPSCLDGLTALAEQRNLNLTIQHELATYGAQSPTSNYEDEVTFIWKGSMSEYKNTLGLVKRIDFSSNRLTGEIPSEVTRLVGLISLNLSRNNLTGHIPPDIGKLEALDSLDMSRNQIGGEIPASLGQIHRLGYLDLSNNNLSGEIPAGTQLQGRLPSFFAGNPHLCGLPLPMCASEKKTNQDDQEDTDKFITGGFYITLALGFIVGFWGVCGSLIFKRKWRYAYYRFLDALNDWFYVKVTLIKRQFKDRCA